MDLLQNSIVAGATLIKVTLRVSVNENLVVVEIEDNGKGMDGDFLKRVISPFTTTRTTRKVGLGIPLMKAGCEQAGGSFEIKSTPGIGTCLQGSYELNNIDRPPLGDFAQTMHTTIVCNPDMDFAVLIAGDDEEISLLTADIREQTGLRIDDPDISVWINEFLNEAMDQTALNSIDGLQ